MKKEMFLFFIIIIMVTITIARPLTVVIYSAPPVMYIDNGKVKGIFPEIFDYIAKKEGIDYKYIYLNFADGLEYLKNDLADIMFGVAYTKERAKYFEYSREPLLFDWGQIFSRENVTLHGFMDLKNKSVAVLKKDVYYEGPQGLKKIDSDLNLNIKFKEYNSYEEVFKSLEDGEVDYALASRIFGLNTRKKYDIKETQLILNTVDIYMIYSNKSLKPIIDRLDLRLKELKRNDESYYYKIINKYLYKKQIPTWILPVLLLIGIITFILIIFIYLMRRNIEKKTKELLERNKELEKNKKKVEKLYNTLKHNMEELQNTKGKLEESQALLESFIEHSIDGILFVNKNFDVILVNNVFKERTRTDFHKNITKGSNLRKIFEGELLFLLELEKAYNEERSFVIEKPIKRRDGSIYWVSNSYYPIYKGGEKYGVALISRDITKLKENEILLEKLAHYDSLTGLYNRRAGMEILKELALLSKRENKPLVIGFVDVDNLKTINDVYGHSKGDEAIKNIANILKSSVRHSDVVARYGGDEFFMGLYNCTIEDAERIRDTINKKLEHLNKYSYIHYSISLGFARYIPNSDIDEILLKADQNMYSLKNMKKKLKDKS
ncbi:PAS domain S-box/diguanylate cyclase (GGDEF) domain-containing protein [Marinitoga piezophila KA3]|uniref:PAS domain S-box/diguanylate cyclase (GGDEF) domain-containing protein n=1 Tax=Marinitoga piezophila (strain DSM 14283 / JCM 11233 / KA3) TaxID=443254 RepID=H2J5L0_MARPK|nr:MULTISPECIES: diguanylate cyclase [Marinitoga]AEX84996.1 PAS domain S-box/diguanylate cyclase (GGDEF) domain-containing protein [Marinitoga piezophila KA3]APT75500.1 hypothetical protein LN42_03155 [Marinitoga sp. 1137]